MDERLEYKKKKKEDVFFFLKSPWRRVPVSFPPIGHTTQKYLPFKKKELYHHLFFSGVPPNRSGKEEVLDERSDLKKLKNEFFCFSFLLNGSSIFREATSLFHRVDDVFVLKSEED